MANWNRQYRFIVKPTGEDGFEIGEPNKDGFAPHISFSIEKTVAYGESGSVNSSKITLWNLTDEQIAVIRENSGCSFTLKAGYGTDLYTIFTGTMKHMQETLDSADKKVEIEAVDSNYYLKNTAISLSYSGTVLIKNVLDDLLEVLSLPAEYGEATEEALENATFDDGYSFIGQVADLLDDICAQLTDYETTHNTKEDKYSYKTYQSSSSSSNKYIYTYKDTTVTMYSVKDVTWNIANGILYLSSTGDEIKTYIPLLNASTGLINIPTRGYDSTTSDGDSSSDVVYYYEINYFLNGAIEVGSYVRIESSIINGTYYVNTISMSGDNLSGDWICTAKVTESSDDTAISSITG